MEKKYFMFILIGAVVLGFQVISFAEMKCGAKKKSCCADDSKVSAENSQGKAVAVGNKICPVLNEKIEEGNKAVYEYKGKIYNFCCPSCIADFKKAPEKYIKALEKQK